MTEEESKKIRKANRIKLIVAVLVGIAAYFGTSYIMEKWLH